MLFEFLYASVSSPLFPRLFGMLFFPFPWLRLKGGLQARGQAWDQARGQARGQAQGQGPDQSGRCLSFLSCHTTGAYGNRNFFFFLILLILWGNYGPNFCQKFCCAKKRGRHFGQKKKINTPQHGEIQLSAFSDFTDPPTPPSTEPSCFPHSLSTPNLSPLSRYHLPISTPISN